MTVEEIVAYVFGDQPSALAIRCAGWARESRRFKEFAETYRDKLRKKARAARDEAGLLDLEAEVGTAFRLLQARRFSVTWEPPVPDGKPGGGRGPDFAVDFTTRFRFYVEVTRPRLDVAAPEPSAGPAPPSESTFGPASALAAVPAPAPPSGPGGARAGAPAPPGGRPDLAARLGAAVCAKLGQLPPGAINVLFLASPGARVAEVALAMGGLKRRAERRDDPFFARRGFDSSRAYLAASRRLSAVLLPEGSLWLNPEAGRPLPAAVRTELEG